MDLSRIVWSQVWRKPLKISAMSYFFPWDKLMTLRSCILKVYLIRVKNFLSKASANRQGIYFWWEWWLSSKPLSPMSSCRCVNLIPPKFQLSKWFSIFLKQDFLDQFFLCKEVPNHHVTNGFTLFCHMKLLMIITAPCTLTIYYLNQLE